MLTNKDLPLIFVFVTIFLVVVMIIITLFIIKSRSKIYEKEIEKINLEIKFNDQIFIKTLESIELERKRIAQDLHDDISSKLVAMSLNLHLLRSKKADVSEKINALEVIQNLVKTTTETSKRISYNLFPPILQKFGLSAAIEELTYDFIKSKQITIDFISVDNLSILNQDTQLHVFRIIQELINNSIKHGNAKQISIQFRVENSMIICDYCDNGKSTDKEKLKNSNGLGFINIETRLKAINGFYFIDFSKKGFNLTFQFNDAIKN